MAWPKPRARVEHQDAAACRRPAPASGWAPAGRRAAAGHSRAACRRRGCRGRKGWPPRDGRRRPAPRPRCCPWRARPGATRSDRRAAGMFGIGRAGPVARRPWRPGFAATRAGAPREKATALSPAGRVPAGRRGRPRWRRPSRPAARGWSAAPAARMPEWTGSGRFSRIGAAAGIGDHARRPRPAAGRRRRCPSRWCGARTGSRRSGRRRPGRACRRASPDELRAAVGISAAKSRRRLSNRLATMWASSSLATPLARIGAPLRVAPSPRAASNISSVAGL